MQVGHLLRLDGLDLALVWGEESLLRQEIGGVTATDLEDPTRFLQRGEIVLSGLVWWGRDGDPARTDRFVSALSGTGAVALLAGEETHGEVPRELAAACRRHRVPLLAVPAHTSFRAITEAVYLRQWGELSRRPTDHHALPENVRVELARALDRGAPVAELLGLSFTHLGTPVCHLVSGSGRTVARTATAPELAPGRAAEALRGRHGTTVRIEADDSVYDAWYLHLPEPDRVPPRVLHEIGELIGRHRRRQDRRAAPRVRAQEELVARTDAVYGDADGLERALRSCGLADAAAYTVVVVASAGPAARGDAPAALAEALRHQRAVGFAVAGRPDGRAVAVLAHGPDPDGEVPARLREVWPLLHACRPGAAPHAGVSDPVHRPGDLPRALAQARYALAGAHTKAMALPASGTAGTRTTAEAARTQGTAGTARTAGTAGVAGTHGTAGMHRTAGTHGAPGAPGTVAPTAGPAGPAAPPGVARLRDLADLGALLAGVPADVRAAYLETVLGPLLRAGRGSPEVLLETLEVFLAHDGSWTRTAEALHLHVNTVHYRIDRVEVLTGRDLSSLDHRLDLRAALLCR
ncbi:PucR family transcriptional regulator [Streptomyces sp. NPDC101490]|uniref:PucR family transcriptional regulator n=1 Tax=Streptomyces sp. NPDC101490 TaxID=3366143 RepID=UPI0038185144